MFLVKLAVDGRDIINISSVAGRTARSGNGVYAATRWGKNGWSEALGTVEGSVEWLIHRKRYN